MIPVRSVLAPFLTLMLACSGVSLCAADDGAKAIQDFQAAMAGTDASAKKDAIRALANKAMGKDKDILPLLVNAVGDRQAGEAAISALTSRTGLPPPRGGKPRPGQDQAKLQEAWQGWLSTQQTKQQVKDLEKEKADREKAAKEAKNKETADKEKKPDSEAKPENASTTPPAEKTVPPAPAEDLGKPDRIVFKSGGSLICFIQSKRLDGDGNLQSLRIIHLDGGGEEILGANLISRIEEDIK